MAEVVLYHHVQGLTAGVVSFADELRRAGHTVHTPDLFDGMTFATIEDGMAHARGVGFDVILERGVAASDSLPSALVYAGFSMGVMLLQGDLANVYRFGAVVFPLLFFLGDRCARRPAWFQAVVVMSLLLLNLSVARAYALGKWAY